MALADNHASEMAASELLYASLSGLQLERLTVRRSLIETLVLIGAAADSAQQQRMYMLVGFDFYFSIAFQRIAAVN